MAEPAVVFERVTFAYPGGTGTPALENISLRVEAGQMLAVIGPNGGGKSTLLKIALGLLRGYAGRAEVFGRSPEEARRERLIGYVPQRSEAELHFPVSARQAVTMTAAAGIPGFRRTPREITMRVDALLERVGAADFAASPVGELSGGQVQRVLIARALAMNPRILALDEPLASIDAAGQRVLSDLIKSLHREMGLTVLLVSHDLRTAAGASGASDRVACLRRTLHFHAAPRGITPQVLAEVFQHDLADIFGDVHVDAHRAAECAEPAAHAPDHGGKTARPHTHAHD